jgi:5,10-methylenetetrahydromethanopterin reductase
VGTVPVGVTVASLGVLGAPGAIEVARRAEELGYRSVWVAEANGMEAFSLLGALGAAAPTLSLGTGVIPIQVRTPLLAAMAAATLQALSPEVDVLLGVGISSPVVSGRWHGVPYGDRPLARIRDHLTLVRSFLSGERVDHDGAFFSARGARLGVRLGERRPKLVLAALNPGMLRLAGELADGALPLLFPPEHWATVRPLIDEGGRRRDPALGPIDLAACLWVSLADDEPAARRALAEKIAYYGHALGPLIYERLGVAREEFAPIERALTVECNLDRACAMVDERMLRIGVAGRPATLVDRLRPLVAAGVRHLSFGPPLGPDPVRAVELLGREVLPALRTAPLDHRGEAE